MKTFFFYQKVTEYYSIQADTEEQALELLYSGDISPCETDYHDVVLDDVEDATE